MSSRSCILTYNVDANIHAFSTLRNGLGVSSGNFGKMNISTYSGDNISDVKKNLRILSEVLEIPKEFIILPKQTHGINCKIITQDLFDLSLSLREDYLRDTDALITNIKNICIGVSTADCVPILLYDKINRVSAAVHAGWKGTVNHIVGYTITKMKDYFSCSPDNIIAILGPAISKLAFEVGQEVYDRFKENKFSMPLISETIRNKWHIDLCQANKIELMKCGVKENNVFLSNICTYSNPYLFFSARRLTFNCGRIYNGII